MSAFSRPKRSRKRLFITLLLLFGVSLVFSTLVPGTPLSFAQQQILVCPRNPAQPALQLLPCYVMQEVTFPGSSPAAGGTPGTTPIFNLPLPGLEGRTPAGSTCQPDSRSSGSCTCPSYEERDYVCNDNSCLAHGGFPALGFGFSPQGGSTSGNCLYPPGKQPPSGVQCVVQCNSKPIIYLYPTHKTLVDVTLSIQGRVTVSDPLYPKDGWKQIEAHPDGTLVYQNKTYHELYYESETVKATPRKEGIFIPASVLKPELERITTELGLNEFEQKEFVDYWVPRLKELNSPYILFSLFPPQEKAKVDTVKVVPQPDTEIEFLVYFKPVRTPYAIEPLQLPKPPQRIGFTVVEWGGTIEN